MERRAILPAFRIRWTVLLGTCLLSIPLAAGDACPANALPFPDPGDITANEQIRYATLFDVEHYSTYKVIKFSNSLLFKSGWPDAALHNQPIPDMVLYKCGTTQPTSSHNGVSADAMFFSIPLAHAAIAGTAAVHFFELLSQTEVINAIDMTSVSSPCQQLLEECNPSIHAPNWHESWANLTLASSAVFTDSWGTGAVSYDLLKNLPFDVSLDSGNLQKAEWIKFAGLFFNQEVEAARIFNRIEADYNLLKAEAQRLQDERTGAVPLVAWVTWQGCTDTACDGITPGTWVVKTDGNWCRCGNFYRLLASNYRRDITQDAGGRLVTALAPPANCSFITNSDGTQTLECTGAEQFLDILSEADMIIDETYVPNQGLVTLSDFVTTFGVDSASQPAMQAEAVFRTDGSVSDPRDDSGVVGTSWFEQLHAQPQELLSDMMRALWGADFMGPCPYRYLRSLYAGTARDPLEHSDCPLYDPQGSHDCDAIHDYKHMVQRCAIVSTSTSSGSSGSSKSSSSSSGSSRSSLMSTTSTSTTAALEVSGAQTGMVLLPCILAFVFVSLMHS